MKNFHRLIFIVICCILLSTTVFAESSVSKIENMTTVYPNGSCEVRMDVTIRMDSINAGLTFPLPKGAKNVTVDGRSARTSKSTDGSETVLVDLSDMDGLVGEYRRTFHFVLPDIVHMEEVQVGKSTEKKLMLRVPLLSGFIYPIEDMNFSIILPADIVFQPSFYSGYLQQSVESRLEHSSGGRSVSGYTVEALNDHETMEMVMEVTPEMFSGKYFSTREGNPEIIPMAICAALALLYWIIFLRSAPIFRQYRSIPLEGVTAGEMASRLTLTGGDLTMIVFTWAQLGYVQICPDRRGKILLQKRMEMGNERGPYENHCFHALFGRRNTVDATGTQYAKLCLQAEKTIPGVRELYRPGSGNVKIFRAISCGVSLFSGICLGMNLFKNPVLQILAAILLAILGVTTAWHIHKGVYHLTIRGKIPVWVGAVCGGIWILMGLLAGQVLIALAAVIMQILAGFLTARGGRRSEQGRYSASQVLGLRHYLRHISAPEMRRCVEQNPDFFFDMIPYAIALGVEKKFAKLYGRNPLEECPYVTSERTVKQTPENWAGFLRQVADRMDRRQKRMQLEKFIPFTFRKL